MKKILALVSILGLAGFLFGDIRVVAPNGGESWAIRSRHTISWVPTGITGTVNVFLMRGARAVGRINAEALPGSTTTLLWVQAGLLMGGTWAPAGTDYKILVQRTDGLESDLSDGNFSLTLSPTVMVSQKIFRRTFRIINTGDATIDAGSPFTLTWTSSGYEGVRAVVVAVPVLDDPSAPPPPAVILGNATVESGRFVWNIHRTYYGRWRLRVVVAADGILLGEMRGRINIMPPTRFRIVSPIGGETYRPGDQVLIRWETINPVPEFISSVHIAIMRFSGGCGSGDPIAVVHTTTPVDIMAREYRLRVPSDAPGSSFYLVDISPFSPVYSDRYVEIHHSYTPCFTVLR